MKASFFQNSLQFSLLIDGESWRQGQSVNGVLTIKNLGDNEVSTEGAYVSLAFGELKKVREKSPEAFTKLSLVNFEAKKLAAKQEDRFEWKFDTDRNCAITSTGSLYLLYGRLQSQGQLQLIVNPDPVITEVIHIFQTDFRFVLKTQKSNKGFVEVKLAPPASRAFATVENLVLSFRFEGPKTDELKIRYLFNVKKIEANVGSMEMKKLKKDLEQTFSKDQYLIPSGRFNHDRIQTAIREVFGQIGLVLE